MAKSKGTLVFWLWIQKDHHSVHWDINPPTKYLVKISQFRFLVMTEKNIFIYKLFLSLNISNLSSFLCKNYNLPKKAHPLFPSNLPLKIQVMLSPPFWKLSRRFNLPTERGVHTMCEWDCFLNNSQKLAMEQPNSRQK